MAKGKKSAGSKKVTGLANPRNSKKRVGGRKSRPSEGGPVETNLIRRVTAKAVSSRIDHFGIGDTVNVYVRVKEGEKERIQVYKGIVIKIQGSGVGRSFTVRKVSAGVGVERTFPFVSPAIESVGVLTTGSVRRAKLYYLRQLEGKAAKVESELVATGGDSGKV